MLGLEPLIALFLGLLLLAIITAVVWFWPDDLYRDEQAQPWGVPGWPVVSRDRVSELRAMSYREYLETPEWSQRSLALRKQARWTCVLCGSGNRVQVHHRTYKRLGNERPADLQVLCRECHRLAHQDRAR